MVRGIFGFSFLLVPFILLLSAYRTEKQSGTPLLRRFLYDLLLTVIVSSFVQIIFVGDIEKKNFIRAISYLYRTGVENAFQSGGVISAILAYPLIRILGATGARITIVILLFLAIMKFLDLSMSQLWGYIRLPFRKLRELWNRDAEWAEDAAPEEEPAEEPEAQCPQKLVFHPCFPLSAFLVCPAEQQHSPTLFFRNRLPQHLRRRHSRTSPLSWKP